MKKSIISVILSVAMLAMMCVPSFVAAATYYQTVSFMGFDDYNGSKYGAIANSSSKDGYSPYTLTKGTGPNGENDTALSVTTTKGGKLHIYYADESVTGSSSRSTLSEDHVKFSYDFYADTTNKSATAGTNPVRFLRSYIGMKTTSGTEQLKFTPQFFWSETESKLALRIGDSDQGRYYIPDKKWYTIEHTYDFTNIKKGKVGILINIIDKETGIVVENIERPEFSEKGGSAYTNTIEYIYFDTDTGNNDFYNANFIFDNFRFEKLVEITQPYAEAYKYNTSTEAVNNLIPYSASNLVIDLGGNKLNNEDITTDNIILTANGEAIAKDKYSVAYSDGALTVTPNAGVLKANTILDVKISSATKIADADVAIGEDITFSLYVGDDNLLYVERTLDATQSKISANIKAVNSANADAVITVITAGYSSNELIDVIVPQVITIPAKSVKDAPINLDMTSSYSYAKVFVLENMTSLKPLIAEKTASVTQ